MDGRVLMIQRGAGRMFTALPDDDGLAVEQIDRLASAVPGDLDTTWLVLAPPVPPEHGDAAAEAVALLAPNPYAHQPKRPSPPPPPGED